MRAVPRLCELYSGICFATEEKHGKSSVRLVEKCPDRPVAAVRHTFAHKQYTEYRERKIHSNKKKKKDNILGISGRAPSMRAVEVKDKLSGLRLDLYSLLICIVY
jgi:hypothetical protein